MNFEFANEWINTHLSFSGTNRLEQVTSDWITEF